MELSTTMPTANAIPAREIILILRPKILRIINTATKVTGILMAIIRTERTDPKNNNRTATANIAPRLRFDLTSRIDSSM